MKLHLYNTLSRTKELFQPIKPPLVGLYVCGPTVYGHAHLGHARPAITFDLLFRYLTNCGLKVRYVRNITDVGHLTDETHGEGEDKLQKQAKLEQLQPMEVAQRFTDSYHQDMDALNVRRPSIEPRASGHIPEQIALIEDIIKNGFAYISNGSVYFNVRKYNQSYAYGILSNRKIEDMMEGYRELEGQDEKHDKLDFALWKKADPEHIMQWPSPWGLGFPGWHIECTAMSTKYLGETFDIHGGGLDLMFPHHEAEVAQANAAHHPCDHEHRNEAKYWMHCNMITIDGQKMGKSLNNFITLKQFYSGEHAALEHAWNPMVIRFFMLQSHYRSTLDFSNASLAAAYKAYKKLSQAWHLAGQLSTQKGGADSLTLPEAFQAIREFDARCHDAMDDDLNSAIVIAEMFGVQGLIRNLASDTVLLRSIPDTLLKGFLKAYQSWFSDVLGLIPEAHAAQGMEHTMDGLVQLLISQRTEAKKNKDFEQADAIRKQLEALHIYLKDTREGVQWTYEPETHES